MRWRVWLIKYLLENSNFVLLFQKSEICKRNKQIWDRFNEFSLCLIYFEKVKGQNMVEFDRQVKIDHRVQYFRQVNNLKIKQFLNNSKKGWIIWRLQTRDRPQDRHCLNDY